MAAGRGLNKGRGLSSLIPPKAEEGDVAAEKKAKTAETAEAAEAAYKKPSAGKVENKVGEVFSVRLTQVVPNQEQPRKQFEESGLEELAASIREHGVITPLLVQKKGKYFELVAGERRWRAARMAGLKKIPVVIREFSEQEAAEIALIENIQRENLNPMEEAMAFRRLQEEFSLRQEDIAKRVSRSRSAIANALRLLKLEDSVQNMLAEGKLSMGHARAILALEDPDIQKVTAEQIVENDLSVRETEKLVRRLLKPVKETEKKPSAEEEQRKVIYRELETQVQKSVGTRVSIHPIKGKKGRIEIEYYSDEDLERILGMLRQD